MHHLHDFGTAHEGSLPDLLVARGGGEDLLAAHGKEDLSRVSAAAPPPSPTKATAPIPAEGASLKAARLDWAWHTTVPRGFSVFERVLTVEPW